MNEINHLSESVYRKIDQIIEEAEAQKYWTTGVKTGQKGFHTPAGLFKEGTAQKIADVVSQNYKAEYRTAMSRLNFYLNRGGKGITPEVREKVNKAKDIIKKKYGRDTK